MGQEGDQLIGQVLGETYRVERLLGGGGMGAVYEASHLRLRRRFAIKVLFSEVAANEEALARFQREAQITSGLGHPHIVEVVDFNHTSDGAPYIVMELLEGRDLEGLLSEEGPLPLDRAAKIFGQIAAALLAAHAQGIIHRDLKPSNVYLCDKAGQRDVVKVVDFGISKVLGSKSVVTRTQATMGTPGYMSPEQAEGRAAEVDVRTDVFAMGTMLYEMLCGRTPFAGESIPTMLYKIVHQEPPPPTGLRADLPKAVEVVVLKALAKKPEDRYQTVEALVAALGESLGGSGAELRGSLLAAAGAVGSGARGAPGPGPVARHGSPVAATTLSSSAVELQRRQKGARTVGILVGGVVVVAAVATALLLLRGDKAEEGAGTGSTPAVAASQPKRPVKSVEKLAVAKPKPPRQHSVKVEGKLRGAECRLRPAGAAMRVAPLPCTFKVLVGTAVELELRYRRAKAKVAFTVDAARAFGVRYRRRKLSLLAAGDATVVDKPAVKTATAEKSPARRPSKTSKPTGAAKAGTAKGTRPIKKPKKKDDWGTPKF